MKNKKKLTFHHKNFYKSLTPHFVAKFADALKGSLILTQSYAIVANNRSLMVATLIVLFFTEFLHRFFGEE